MCVTCHTYASFIGAEMWLDTSMELASRPIFLDHVFCSGNESQLLNCASQIGQHTCGYSEAVFIACEGTELKPFFPLTNYNYLFLA